MTVRASSSQSERGGSGQLAKAVTLLKETLAKQKAKLGPDHPDTLTSMGNLALAYQGSGLLGKAVTLGKAGPALPGSARRTCFRQEVGSIRPRGA
jgi:hypothetical protein